MNKPIPFYNHKYGFHINAINKAVEDAILSLRPQVIKTLEHDVNFWRHIRQELPDVFIIGRLYDPHQQYSDNPKARGQAFAERILAEEINHRTVNGRLIYDAWESFNEAVPDSAPDEVQRRYDEFQVAFAERLRPQGLEPIGLNFGTGNYLGAQILQNYSGTLETYRYLGFHEYDWPTMDRLHQQGLAEGNGGMWLCLRYRRMMNQIRPHYTDQHLIIITECGMTQAVYGKDRPDVGPWHDSHPISSDDYWQSLLWYNQELMQDETVLGACLFVVGAQHPWESFEHLGPILDRLSGYQRPYEKEVPPEPEPEEPTQPDLKIIDRRAQMPNYDFYKTWQRSGKILGVTVHHTGTTEGDALSLFRYQVETLGWAHGAYTYIITPDGQIQYALDEQIAAYHATINDPSNALDLDYGQYWNNHYLAVALVGDFNQSGPTQAQSQALILLLHQLRQRYQISIENIRVHRELRGVQTQCPGFNLDPAQLRQQLRQPPPEPLPPVEPPQPERGQHVVLVPDTDAYFTAALGYIWKFQPDVSFNPQTIAGTWLYITAIGEIDQDLLAEYRQAGAEIVQHIPGSAESVQTLLDKLARQNQRFLPLDDMPATATLPKTYTVQPGDTLSKIAAQIYGQATKWPDIYQANRNQLPSPNMIRVGMKLVIP